MIVLSELDRKECVRYLGDKRVQMNSGMEALLAECEQEVLSCAVPKYLYKEIELPFPALIEGEDIKNHLSGCEKAIVLCASLGVGIDNLIRKYQITDMAKAVVIDSFSSVAVEQVCSKLDLFLARQYPNWNMTFRFSPGYGDYPISLQGKFLSLLDAPRKIGLCTNETCLLTPTKSVTAILGLSRGEVERKKRGCAICSLRETCRFRKKGEHCGF